MTFLRYFAHFLVFYVKFYHKTPRITQNLLTNIKKTYIFERFSENCLRTQKKVLTFAIANKKDIV